MDDREKRVHLTHCCKKHGCKYSDPNCPIAYGDEEQVYPCPDCDDYHYDDDLFYDSPSNVEALISEAVMAERRKGYDKECKSFWQGFIWAFLVIILIHILLSYILL